MPAKETEKWYKSKTIIGTILVLVVVLLRSFGQEDIAATVETEAGGLADWIIQAVTLVAAALTFWGRLTAKKDIVL